MQVHQIGTGDIIQQLTARHTLDEAHYCRSVPMQPLDAPDFIPAGSTVKVTDDGVTIPGVVTR